VSGDPPGLPGPVPSGANSHRQVKPPMGRPARSGSVPGAMSHRQPGEPILGEYAEHPDGSAGRPAATQASRVAAANADEHAPAGHDYGHLGDQLEQLPAWFFILRGHPVPDDAPLTTPPPGFHETMQRIAVIRAERARMEQTGEPDVPVPPWLAAARSGAFGGGGWDPLGRAEIAELNGYDDASEPAPPVAGDGDLAVGGDDDVRGDGPGPAPRADQSPGAAVGAGGPVGDDRDPGAVAGSAEPAGPDRKSAVSPAPSQASDPVAPAGPDRKSPVSPGRPKKCRRGCGYPAGSLGCRVSHGQALHPRGDVMVLPANHKAARTIRTRHAPTGVLYWAQVRVGWAGNEYNFGGGWRNTPAAAWHVADRAGVLRQVQPQEA
jgi:hypothetical protein